VVVQVFGRQGTEKERIQRQLQTMNPLTPEEKYMCSKLITEVLFLVKDGIIEEEEELTF